MTRPLFLVPGFTQTRASWDAVIAALDDGDVRAVDVPLGRSFADTARALGEAHGAGTWCGYSMGGRLALRLALDAPQVVDKLVVVSATPGIDDAAERAARRSRDDELAATIERDGVEQFLARWLAQPMFAAVPLDAPGLAERQSFTAPQLARTLRDLGTGAMEPLWPRLGELTMPTLIVHGSRDGKFTTLAARLADGITNARRVAVDCGHAVPLEAPVDLARLLHEFHRPTATSSASTS